MKLIRIYECLCDETRLRIVHLLTRGPLCVCHLQELLGESQVKISKHLAYLKERGLVEANRHQNWMIYTLPNPLSPELAANLKCLRECEPSVPVFRRDSAELEKLLPEVEWLASAAAPCGKAPKPANAARAKPRSRRAALAT